MISPDAKKWFWFVGSKIYSRAANSYVPPSDPDYSAWADDGNRTFNLSTEAELWDLLVSAGVAPPEWTFDGETFVPPGPGVYSARQLAAYAADRRWAKEVGGIVVSDIPVATDDRSKQMIMGARIAAEADSGFTTPWVGSDGSVNTLNATQVIAISNAVLAHVQSCFSIFATLIDGIAGETITECEEIDAAFAS